MKAPNEIYLFQSKNDGSVGVAHHEHPVETEKVTSIKYVRADLAELTWGDIPKIISLYEQLHDKNGPVNILKLQDFYKEVLRRFLENKRIKNEK